MSLKNKIFRKYGYNEKKLSLDIDYPKSSINKILNGKQYNAEVIYLIKEKLSEIMSSDDLKEVTKNIIKVKPGRLKGEEVPRLDKKEMREILSDMIDRSIDNELYGKAELMKAIRSVNFDLFYKTFAPKRINQLACRIKLFINIIEVGFTDKLMSKQDLFNELTLFIRDIEDEQEYKFFTAHELPIFIEGVKSYIHRHDIRTLFTKDELIRAIQVKLKRKGMKPGENQTPGRLAKYSVKHLWGIMTNIPVGLDLAPRGVGKREKE